MVVQYSCYHYYSLSSDTYMYFKFYFSTTRGGLLKKIVSSFESRELSRFNNMMKMNKKITLAEFAMTPTVYLGPCCICSAHIPSILNASFKVLAGIAGDYNGSPQRSRSGSMSSRNCLCCSACNCRGIAYYKTIKKKRLVKGSSK